MKHKLISVLLAACMAASAFAVGAVQTSASSIEPQLAQDTVQGGAILHCLDWSYNNIKAALPDIAAAGYTAVQTSPVQSPKDYSPYWTNTRGQSGQWWKMYQPLGFTISDGNSWLGTKQQLKDLCEEAELYDIKVIVDIVANHLANDGYEGTYEHLNSGVESDMKNPDYFHNVNEKVNDDNRYNITQRYMNAPDLNTGHDYVQQKVKSLLRDCVDCGVDGFRFDAAKHIELPTDDGCASDFWPNVLGDVREYARNEYNKNDLFIYGEVIGGAGTYISNYTRYMAVTDDATGNNARNNAQSQNAEGLRSSNYEKGAGAENSILWAESHDTYLDGGSDWISDDVIARTWAIVGSRNGSTSLFLARPSDTMGAASTDTSWKSSAVAEVNKFKNFFNGQSEYLDSSYSTAYNVRGDSGVVISKLDINEYGGYVKLDAHGMKDGEYKDRVSGSTFTVSGGYIEGTVGETGVAVVYNDTRYIDADTICLNPGVWKTADTNERFAAYLFNNFTGDYTWVDLSESNGYSAAVPEGKWEKVIFCRMDGETKENNWDNKWNQTDDLVPDSGCNRYNIDAWNSEGSDKSPGHWDRNDGSHTSIADGNPVWSWENDYSSATATFDCTLCGISEHKNVTLKAEITNDYTHARRHGYIATVTLDGKKYTDTKYTALEETAVAAKSITLRDEIGVNYYVNTDANTDLSSATVTYTWEDGREAEPGRLEKVKSGALKGLYVAVCDVPAAAMTNNVNMTISSNGNEIVSDTYRVVNYAADAAAQYGSDEKLKNLLCNMLAYGGATQEQFDYRTGDLASDYIGDVDPGWTGPNAPESLTDTSTIKDVDFSGIGITFRGAALSVTSKVTVRLLFDVSDASAYAEYNGERLDFMPYKNTGMKYIEIENIAAPNIFDDLSVQFINGESSASAVYNPIRYYNAVVSRNNHDALENVMKTMYGYSSSAKDYLS